MNKRKKILFIIICIFVVLVLFTTLFILWGKKDTLNSERRVEDDFAKIEIKLQSVDLDTLESDKNIKYDGNEVIIFDNDGKKKFNDVEIKGHGNSTWQNDKKPFQLNFKYKTNLFGLANVKKWLLLANDSAFYLGRMLDINYEIVGEFLELSINDDYRGLYYIVPKIDINKGSVNLYSPFGILVEIDNLHGQEKGCYYSDKGDCLTIKDVVNDDNVELAMEQFIVDFNQLEIVAEKKEYDKIVSLIDVESFAKYYLLSEFTVNPDAYTTSWYIYKDGVDDKIHAGPGWDYDYALGNRNWIWASSEDFYSPEFDMVREKDAMGGEFIVDGELIKREPDEKISKIMYWLMKMPQFKEEVKKIFMKNMSGNKEDMLAYMRAQASKIYPIVLKDSGRWKQTDYWT